MANNVDDGVGSSVDEKKIEHNQQQHIDGQEEQQRFVFDRNWLKHKLQKYSNDERLKKYYETLHPKYPILVDKALVVAPMVDQSDLPFRLLCRRYGSNLCFTPMIHARMFQERVAYRNKFWKYVNGMPPEDRPLIVQLCGSDKEALSYTVNYILNAKNRIDGIDLNCGCPQTIAKRGKYGAFLLEMDGGNVIQDVVKHMVKEFGHIIPISVKVRILPSGLEDSLKLYTRLVDAGASMLTVHGRTRLQKGLKTGHADWDAIKEVVDLLGHRVPILSNGSISNLDDVVECLQVTGVDGIMSSEAILEYPAVFTETGTLAVEGKRSGPGRIQIAREYLALCEEYPPDEGGQGNGVKCARAHIHRFLHKDFSDYEDIRNEICFVEDYDLLWKAVDDVEKRQKESGHDIMDEVLNWYMRHRVVDDDGVLAFAKRQQQNKEVKNHELDDEAADCLTNLFGNEDEEQCW